MSKAGEKLIAGAKEMVAIAKGEQPAAVLHWQGHEYVPASALRAAQEREKVLVEALEPFAREGDIPDGAIPDDASLIYLNAATRLYARDLKRARAAIPSQPANAKQPAAS